MTKHCCSESYWRGGGGEKMSGYVFNVAKTDKRFSWQPDFICFNKECLLTGQGFFRREVL